MKLFVEGRKDTFKLLSQIDFSTHQWLWFHCASLGEYEQAVPLIEELKKENYRILVSFFSPSGYEQKKNSALIDYAIYLPIDTVKNAQYLVKKVQPKKAFFIKYEFWENYFTALNQLKIPLYMVSSTFRENQIFFKWYGSFSKSTLKRVSHFFVQNENSKQVLQANGFSNCSISGDTRYDRVNAQLQMDNTLSFITEFKKNRLCVVLGSTWPDCETVFIHTINNSPKNTCFIIAPHEINAERIASLTTKITAKTSVLSKGIDPNANVLIIDAIGYLTRVYSYADIAYVGGAVGTTGLHNILEPAVFGIPILVGPNTKKFPEATALQKYGGLVVVNSPEIFKQAINSLILDSNYRTQVGVSSKKFVQNQIGATKIILNYIKNEKNIRAFG